MNSSQSGFSILSFLFFLLIIFGLFLGLDYGYIYVSEFCGDTPISTCFSESPKKAKKNDDKKTLVTATGSFTYRTFTADISLTFPLEGGVVTGVVGGDCKGNVNGMYSGGEFGTISGKVFGSCAPFYIPIPAKATFTGTVHQQQKTVPINGSGNAAGFSGSGSVTLMY